MKIFNKTIITLAALLVTSTSFASKKTDMQAFNFSKQLAKKIADNLAKEHEYLKRTEISIDVTEDAKPLYDILTVQPLYLNNNGDKTIFTQGRIAYGDDGRTTTNIGVGYRFLTLDEKILLGVNTFHDYEFPYHHQRIGHGIEIKSSALEFNSNYYNAITDWHYATQAYVEKALDGYDMEVGIQVPYLPWARAYAKKFYYDGIAADNDTNGEQFSLRLTPHSAIEIEGGLIEDDATKSVQFVKTTIRIGWGGKKSKNRTVWVDKKPFNFSESMREQMLDKVRRSNTIRKEVASTAINNVSISMKRAN